MTGTPKPKRRYQPPRLSKPSAERAGPEAKLPNVSERQILIFNYGPS